MLRIKKPAGLHGILLESYTRDQTYDVNHIYKENYTTQNYMKKGNMNTHIEIYYKLLNV